MSSKSLQPKQPGHTPRPPVVLGIDLGGTKILAGAVSATGKILGRGKVKTPFTQGNEAVTAALAEAARAALSEAGIPPEDVTHLGLAAPGPLDPATGRILRSVNLKVENYKVLDELGVFFPNTHRKLQNDVRLAALAEAHLGAGRGARSLVAIWAGTGIGGGIILDGKIHAGSNANAGEIGHIVLDFRRARKGEKPATLEEIGAKVGMTAFLERRIARGEKSVLEGALKKKSRIGGTALKEAFEAKDPLMVEAAFRSAEAVGMAIGSLFNILAPELFVLGGGIAENLGAPYLEKVRETAPRFCITTDLAPLRIEPSALGDDACLLGAALFVRQES